MMPSKIDVTYEWFISNVDTSAGPESCHPWTGPRHSKGYGQFGKDQLAHRWLLGYLRGTPLGPGEQALHNCDFRLCCNPQHLYIGTAAENSGDMVLRARNPVVVANMAKTHCPRDHEYAGDNVYINTSGYRECRACRRIRSPRRGVA